MQQQQVRTFSWRAVALAMLLATAGFGRPGPGRIAVGGAYPHGYVGLLARYGLPRDLLSADQLAAPDVLASYDLVIIAGLSGNEGDLTQGLDAVLAKGGCLLLDYGPPGRSTWRSSRGGTSTGAGYFQIAAPSRSPFRISAPTALGLAADQEFSQFSSRLAGFAPRLATSDQTTVLAEFRATTAPDQVRDMTDRNRRPEPDRGPAMPAIILERRGPGRIIHCGPSIGMATALGGLDFDDLVLSFLNLLTDGRVVPQLEPEGGRLARRESFRSRHETTAEPPVGDQPVEEAPDGLPDGPGTRAALPAGFAMLEPEASASYHVTGATGTQPVALLLNYWNSANQLRLDLTASGATFTRLAAGQATTEKLPLGLPAGATFTVKVRDGAVVLLAGGKLATWPIPQLTKGLAAVKGAAGEVLYQPTEPVYFADDFMRTDDSDGGWETAGGRWHTAPVQNPDMGANPFSFKVEPKGYAAALQGFPFWDEYRADVALRAGGGQGWIGVGCYAQDADNLLLFQAKVGNAATPSPDGFRLVRREQGRDTVLAAAPGGVARGQWYQVRVKVEGPWFGAFVDGQKVLVTTDRTWAGGRLALAADGVEARFDDVVVEPCGAPDERGTRLVARVPDYAGTMDLDSWAGPATPWEPDPASGGLFWRRDTFFGDVGMRFDLTDLPDGASAALLADGDGRSADSGYTVRVTRGGDVAEVTLAHGGRTISRGTVPSALADSLVLRKKGDRVLGLLADKVVVEANETDPPVGGRLAFQADGYLPRVSSVAVWSLNLKDETFDAAPVRWWVGSGEWDVTNRWSCTPDWSWFGGISMQVAAIWYKQELGGDQVLDFYAGAKMTDGSFGSRERVGDFNAVLCGDGQGVEHGYSFVVGPREGGAAILKDGHVVARNAGFRLFTQGHNRWANVRAEKHGGRILLYVDDQLVVQYLDPEPLSQGFAGIWTQRNGIMIPRVTLSYQQLGERVLSLPGVTATQLASLPAVPVLTPSDFETVGAIVASAR